MPPRCCSQVPYGLLLRVLRAHPAAAAERLRVGDTDEQAGFHPLVLVCRASRHDLPVEVDEDAMAAEASLAELLGALAEAYPPAASLAVEELNNQTPCEILRRVECCCDDGPGTCPCGEVSAPVDEAAVAAVAAVARRSEVVRVVSDTVAALPGACFASPEATDAAAAAAAAGKTPGRLQLRLLRPLAEALSAESADLMTDTANWLGGVRDAAASLKRLGEQLKEAEAAAATAAAAAAAEELEAQLPRPATAATNPAAAGAAVERISVSDPEIHDGSTLGFVSQLPLWPEMNCETESMKRVAEAFAEIPPGSGAKPSDAPFLMSQHKCDICSLSGETGVFGCGWLRCTTGCEALFPLKASSLLRHSTRGSRRGAEEISHLLLVLRICPLLSVRSPSLRPTACLQVRLGHLRRLRYGSLPAGTGSCVLRFREPGRL